MLIKPDNIGCDRQGISVGAYDDDLGVHPFADDALASTRTFRSSTSSEHDLADRLESGYRREVAGL